MHKCVNKREINCFLDEFKDIVINGSGLDIVPTPKNKEALIKLKINEKIREKYILDLDWKDYFNGPVNDKDKPGVIWEFGIKIKCDVIYIKLKIVKTGKEIIAKCLSFHITESPIIFPYKI